MNKTLTQDNIPFLCRHGQYRHNQNDSFDNSTSASCTSCELENFLFEVRVLKQQISSRRAPELKRSHPKDKQQCSDIAWCRRRPRGYTVGKDRHLRRSLSTPFQTKPRLLVAPPVEFANSSFRPGQLKTLVPFSTKTASDGNTKPRVSRKKPVARCLSTPTPVVRKLQPLDTKERSNSMSEKNSTNAADFDWEAFAKQRCEYKDHSQTKTTDARSELTKLATTIRRMSSIRLQTKIERCNENKRLLLSKNDKNAFVFDWKQWSKTQSWYEPGYRHT